METDNPVEVKARTTPRQMALALFEDMFDLGMPINEANREIGYQRNNFDRSWSALRRLGHRDELSEWVRQGSPELARPHSALSQLGDWDLSYPTPG